jgi:DNA-binding NarL/FixJ family response regulator
LGTPGTPSTPGIPGAPGAPGAPGTLSAPGTPGASGTPSAPGAPLRLVVADDQASVREGLAIMLDLLPDVEVVGTAADGRQALEQVAALRPDAILLDLHMPVMDGTEATRRLTAEHPEVAVVVLTTYADDRSVVDTLRAGARSFLTKDADRSHIARTLHSAVAGLTVLHPSVQATLLAAAHVPPADPAPPPPADPDGAPADRTAGAARAALPDGLTRREAEILALIARGLNNAEIAAQLYLSHNTVKTHINRIFAKTASRDRAAATRYAQSHGLI